MISECHDFKQTRYKLQNIKWEGWWCRGREEHEDQACRYTDIGILKSQGHVSAVLGVKCLYSNYA